MDEALIQQMLQAGVTEERERALNQRMRRGQVIASMFPTPQGANVGGTYQAASPLEHLASAMARVVGMRQMKGAEDELAGLGNQRAQGRQAFVDALVKASTPQQPAAPVWEPPDFMKPPSQNEPLSMAPPKAPAPKLSLGVLGALSGDPALAAAGRAMGDEEARAAAEAAARQKAEREGLSLQADMDYRTQQLGLGRDRLALDRDRLRVDQEQAAAAAMRKAQEDAARAAGAQDEADGKRYISEDFTPAAKPLPPPVQADLQKRAAATRVVLNNADALEELIRSGGPAVWGQRAGQLSMLANNIWTELKDIKGLGVLAGPDMGILQGILADPTKLQTYLKDAAGAQTLLPLIQGFKERMKADMTQRVQNYGAAPAEGGLYFSSPAQAPQSSGPAAQRAQGNDGNWYVLRNGQWEPE